MRVINICAVIVTAIAVYFFVQDRVRIAAYTKSEDELRSERVQKELERMGISPRRDPTADTLDEISQGDRARMLKDFQDELKRLRGN